MADELPRNHGKLILDATVAEQAIRYPTDLGLLNEARELSERIIDELHAKSNRAQKKKPRTYREIARKAYLSLVKLRRPSSRKRRAGIRQQLQFLQRNLKHIEEMLTEYPHGTPIPIPNGLLRRYWVLPHLYQQQYEMYKTNTRRCDDRIVSISQPYIRPIIRGKPGKIVEFGAKISVSLTGTKGWHMSTSCTGTHSTKVMILKRKLRPTKNVTAIIPKSSLLTRYMVHVIIAATWHAIISASQANHWDVHQRSRLKTKMN